MTGEDNAHNEIIRQEFTRQAVAYASSPAVTDRERIDRLVAAVAAGPQALVLDVATGPGYVAMGFAVHCREVVGIDLTEAPLELAEAMRVGRGLTNLRFLTADAAHLPFDTGYFDVVVSRLAFHHFEDPAAVLAEMVRVCRGDGTIAVEDLIASEHPARAAYQNRFERLRDPSHVRALPLSELLGLLAAAGTEVETVYTARCFQPVERWLATAQTPAGRAAEVRTLLEQDELQDLSGTCPMRRDGALVFTHRTATAIGRNLTHR